MLDELFFIWFEVGGRGLVFVYKRAWEPRWIVYCATHINHITFSQLFGYWVVGLVFSSCWRRISWTIHLVWLWTWYCLVLMAKLALILMSEGLSHQIMMSRLISWVIRDTHFADTLGIWGHMAPFDMPRNQRTALMGLSVIWAETSIGIGANIELTNEKAWVNISYYVAYTMKRTSDLDVTSYFSWSHLYLHIWSAVISSPRADFLSMMRHIGAHHIGAGIQTVVETRKTGSTPNWSHHEYI